MSIGFEERDKGLFVITASGLLTKADKKDWEVRGREAIRSRGKIRILLVLVDFEGWEKSNAWSDMTFMMTEGDQIEKIAVVGDLRWREPVFMFLGKSLRPTEIEFFTEEAPALHWLSPSSFDPA